MSLIHEIEQLYCKTENGEIEIDKVLESDSMLKMIHAIISKASELSDKSKTSKLCFKLCLSETIGSIAQEHGKCSSIQ